ncbi:pyridoxamine 5'-phosphate oxidase family protein, partial [Pseudomonas aeruginosa]|uniref:pyridoxamine 5'-phosphate oxidase family protein n=1 Tax=Pseudomonas aeruginosa TaxID=287 RepID=UPI0021F19588
PPNSPPRCRRGGRAPATPVPPGPPPRPPPPPPAPPPEPRALALATVDGQGRPSTRIVVIAELGERGVVFATHADSQKGRELAQNPWASG